MELHHLRYFLAVAEDLSFTSAARRLKMAQPPLSRQIQSLESELGVQLFERRSRKVFLTDSGLQFMTAARLVLEQAQLAVDVARQSRNGELGTVRVGFGKGLGDVVSLVINQHVRLFPEIEFDFRDILSGHQSESLLSRKIDVGFSHGPATSLEVTSEKLFRESLSVVLARANPLAKRRYLRLNDLRHETLLLIERWISPHVHDLALSLCRNAGLSPRIVMTESTCYDEAGALMAASGKGVFLAVGKNPTHPSFADRLVALNLREPQATIEVHAAWRRGESSRTILNFIQSARTQLQGVTRVLDMRDFPHVARPASPRAIQRRKRR
ncbi:MAG TPA: LysR substrate-binding domain-containing protein [Candidatus Acidoferrales bacterium]|nr:LysR substrate-binding domain-containing protein [Candidatus Acidoferrales bacterium]